MEYLILGGDARMSALGELLRERGHGAAVASDALEARALLPRARRVVTNCPGRLGIGMEELLAAASGTSRIYLCGPGRFEGDARVVDLWGDERLLEENAWLTAEGAVASAMRASRSCLRGMPCAVIGWGRIGKALTAILTELGAEATVVTRSPEHAEAAARCGARAELTEGLPRALARSELIFSTPPARVLDGEALDRVRPEAMVIDLASPPYGVDLQAAWRMNLRAWREPGLPGRYCPKSAARALLDAMKRSDEHVD